MPHSAVLLALPFFGAAVGAAGAALGIGGGIFIVPFLALVAGLPMHQAVAASLAGIVSVSVITGTLNALRGLANLRLAAALGLTTAAGSAAGALFSGLVAAGTLRLLFSLTLLPLAVLMWPRRGAAAPPEELPAAGGLFAGAYHDSALGRRVAYEPRRLRRASAVSALAGALSGLLGIGGGVVQVPLMHLFCGVPMKAAAATSNILVGVSALGGLAVYWSRGQVPAAETAALCAGAVPGALLGALLLRRARGERLQAAFSALAFAVAVKMLLS